MPASRSWLPVHQIYQGNCGGVFGVDVLKWYHINLGADTWTTKARAGPGRWAGRGGGDTADDGAFEREDGNQGRIVSRQARERAVERQAVNQDTRSFAVHRAAADTPRLTR